ncbi:hypothetical protein [Streptomyces sp. NPDC088785]|uniref:hypothetical protein n=1 Tax=Streptomyces sp. NPDC088785 TaxID=3365897 RepID=UPI0037FB0941
MTRRRPRVGDEVREGNTDAIVTDVVKGVPWLRAPGREPWEAADPDTLIVTRPLAQRDDLDR